MKKKYIVTLLMGLALVITAAPINVVKAAESQDLLFCSINDIQGMIDIQKQSQSERNIFKPKEKQVFSKDDEKLEDSQSPILSLIETGYKSLGIYYWGQMIFEDGMLVAQINYRKKTYLVTKGSTVAQYKVTALTKDSITLQNSKGGFIDIPYRKTVLTNERIAKIKECNSQRIAVLSKDSKFFGYKVLDINEDSVIVSKYGQHLKLEKGTVHK